MSIKQLINRNSSTVNENSSIFSIFLVWLFVCFSFNVVSTYTARIEEIYQMFRKDKHQRSKYWLCKFGSRLQVTVLYHRKVLLICFHTNFRFKGFLVLWKNKLDFLNFCLTRHWQPTELSCGLKNGLFRERLLPKQVMYNSIKKSITLMLRVPRRKNSRFCS